MRKVSVCLLSFILLFSAARAAVFAHTEHKFPKASEGQVNEALAKLAPIRFLPSHPLYFVISLKETVSRLFKPSAVERTKFDLVLGGKRLKEAYGLLENGDIKRASKNFTRYSDRLLKMNNQLEKARSQNQDVSVLVLEIAEGLRIHETMFFEIQRKLGSLERNYAASENFDTMVETFKLTVGAIDNVKPGLKDRFETITEEAANPYEFNTQSPLPSAFEATSSIKPRRIIY